MGIVLRENRIRRNGHRVLLVQASYALVSTKGADFGLRGISSVTCSRFFTLAAHRPQHSNL
jgi:hypothetical protein